MARAVPVAGVVPVARAVPVVGVVPVARAAPVARVGRVAFSVLAVFSAVTHVTGSSKL
ncbi:hypothetical protein [Streptomyces sp. NPDC091294]|uniref:hypothetical protein n=1 Tax=Streptomyces sp. NPDC091294 TaxID=3365992 RepID=UPI00380B4311